MDLVITPQGLVDPSVLNHSTELRELNSGRHINHGVLVVSDAITAAFLHHNHVQSLAITSVGIAEEPLVQAVGEVPEVLPHPVRSQRSEVLQSLLEREGDKDRVIKMDLV
jgi:hypothetical protein